MLSLHKKCLKVCPPIGSVADVGCGKHKICAKAKGIDIDSYADSEETSNLFNIQEKFDTVYCIQTVQYLLDPDFYANDPALFALDKLRNLLKPNGTICVTFTNPWSLFAYKNHHGSTIITPKDLRWMYPGAKFYTAVWGTYIIMVWKYDGEVD